MSKWALGLKVDFVYATKNKNSLSAARKLFDEFIPKFGFPTRFHSDQGGEFTSDMFRDLNKLAGIKASTTTPYHPQGNGACERMNRVLIGMLRSLAEIQKNKWMGKGSWRE